MRRTFAGVGVALLLTAAGCNHLRTGPNNGGPAAAVTAGKPEPAALVRYLNENADRAQAIKCTRVAMDCKEGNQAVGVDGLLVCKYPRYFRLKGSVLGKPAVDIGSNDSEFWYWISEAKPTPYVFHCSYEALGRGGVRLPFPFQPDMIIAALGIGRYDPNGKYQVVMPAGKNYFELIEDTVSPEGQPVKKVTAFNSRTVDVNRGQPQVIGYALKDAQGNILCQATVQEVQVKGKAILPRKVTLNWPAQKMEMKMVLSDVSVVNNLDPNQPRLFQRNDLSNLPSFDLARRAPDGQPSSLIRASGPGR
ncbi:MAG TPA: hypothetical protein VFE78_10380 [Gemmataceae bacterium]|jgi:hypothetical protein|nr:hypothetical protein [Gemmataceae bacterium]